MIVNNFVPSEKVFESSLNINNIKTSPSEKNFQSALKDSLDKLNEKQINADNITNDFISGKDVEVHEMMLSMEESKMSLQLAIQVRNKVVEAVQELTRMQL
ncbi:flagellar hook-basal body complex protein FliE [Clostridium tertium]|jgi:flagellar hook-basal body complex protein FliE|uniref:flagellar hook-basal body complex protein FliE n=1 Tax=Clostridium TaxID=1485 RepID=UPI00115AE950|nr:MULTISPECIES: flagellar hook-basal body complex protein FliE [Clostridium]MBS5304984.1 flagellar hook-basal body complex protein FliE [Clostridium sp.]MDB1922515.1 flagellar hook-basal body complex protein FliE [Clostridium tertium]MDB1926268.1 flagellar hook-basal body complex protein FliE [Clostridium tertium]MDB1928872.1 flagellar hook-basal body complex protein FliE [Clostridium tertium]MDB1932258.1 flagellar hook-basal body complex protein FliE [Clostridium tertium]